MIKFLAMSKSPDIKFLENYSDANNCCIFHPDNFFGKLVNK